MRLGTSCSEIGWRLLFFLRPPLSPVGRYAGFSCIRGRILDSADDQHMIDLMGKDEKANIHT